MKNLNLSLLGVMLALTTPTLAQAPAAPSPAAQTPAMFPFVLPWDDASPGTITDVSFLNAKPAGVHGYIVARQGHFVEANTGQRVRFLGMNFAANAAFPSHADAEKVAARIAKLGINLVRLHHMDNSDWGQDASIWDYSHKDRQHISATQLDKLDYLIAQFKKNGVYVNLNLHVSRQFSEADGFPASVSSIPTGYGKRVDEFDTHMIALQKNYAHELLTHVNPYTHLSYASDPAVAVVEINNENSLVGDPWAVSGDSLDTLPEPFRGELVGEWNAWLRKKYGTESALHTAWTAGLTAPGPPLNSKAVWTIESQGTTQAVLTTDAQQAQAGISQVDGTDWHVQVHQTELDLHNDATYSVMFRAKADQPRSLPVATSLDQNDWHNVGLDVNAALTTDWKTFHYTFTAHDIVPAHCRLTFTLGGQTGTVWIDALVIHPGSDGAVIPAGQSFAAQTIDIPESSLKTPHADWIHFLADTERDYAEGMRGYLKNTLHVHANVICSQISWGGLTGLNRETNSDFADNHAYWQHPSFSHKQWDSNDWNIANTPMVTELASGGGGTLRDLAEYRVAGKPYTVSEYNHPAPSDYRVEMMPEYATFAAFQDWDAIYLFDYGAYGTGADNEKINGYFGISSDPAKTAFLPAAAMIFRASEVPSSPMKTEGYLWADESFSGAASQIWTKAEGGGNPDIFFERLSLAVTPTVKPGKNETVSLQPLAQQFTTDQPPVKLSALNAAGHPRYLALSDSVQAVAGYVGGQTVTLGENTLVFPAFGNNFAAVTLTAMDGKPTTQSAKLLLTLVGKVENQGMGWNADRTSVGSQWGHGPTVVEGIPATVTLKTTVARPVWALDGTGRHSRSVPATYANGTLTFTVGPQYQTLWYAIGE